jgi:hypothetical protein
MSEFTSFRQTKNPNTTSLAAVIDKVRTCPHLKASTGRIHATARAEEARGSDHAAIKKAIRALKMQLPLITPSGIFRTRESDGLEAYSGLICADVDDLGAQLEKIHQAAKADKHVAALFRSPSGTGLKIFYRVGDEPRDHARYFEAVAGHVRQHFGVSVDASTKDMVRACFLCSDPDAFYRENAVPLQVPEQRPDQESDQRPDQAPEPTLRLKFGKLTAHFAEVLSALEHVDPAPRENWLMVGMALHAEYGQIGRMLWDPWSETAQAKHDPQDQERTWQSFRADKEDAVGIGTVFHMAREAGWKGSRIVPTPFSLAQLPPLGKADTDVLLGDAFLCRGKCLLFVAPTGVGKSTMLTQAAMFWATWRPDPALNIMPSIPLKTLHLHAESDLRDIHRMRDRVLASPFWSAEAEGMARAEERAGKKDPKFNGKYAAFYTGLTAPSLKAELQMVASEGVEVFFDNLATSGKRFIDETLTALLECRKPDLVILDPLLAFFGGDVNSQEESGRWLRQHLGPVLERFNCGCILVAHTAKPSRDRAHRNSFYDHAYASLGSVEWSNYPRSILSLEATKDPEIFVLRAAKRGADTRWRNSEGKRIFERVVRRATEERDGWSGWTAEADEPSNNPSLQAQEEMAKVLGLFPELSVAKPPFKEETIFHGKRSLIAEARRLGISKDKTCEALETLEREGSVTFAGKGPRNQHWYGRPDVVEAYRDYHQKRSKK